MGGLGEIGHAAGKIHEIDPARTGRKTFVSEVIDFWTAKSILAPLHRSHPLPRISPCRLNSRKRLPLIAAVIVVVALIVGGTIWWLNGQRWESTDNAFVQADTTLVSPQLSGRVTEVLGGRQPAGRGGQILVKLDDSDQRPSWPRAEANLAAAVAAVGHVDAQAEQNRRPSPPAPPPSARPTPRPACPRRGRPLRQAGRTGLGLAAAHPDRARLGRHRRRQRAAGPGRPGPPNSAPPACWAPPASRASPPSNRPAPWSIRPASPWSAPSSARPPPASSAPAACARPVRQRRNATAVHRAPDPHSISSPTSRRRSWTRCAWARRSRFRPDAFPGRKIQGRVDSFAPATGSEFALIPVENATGNFTKITQRVPVRIVVSGADRSLALRPGLSVDVKID